MPAVTRKTRQSNFEALRIVAMLMIVTYHYCLHGVQHGDLWLQGSLSHRLIAVFLF